MLHCARVHRAVKDNNWNCHRYLIKMYW